MTEEFEGIEFEDDKQEDEEKKDMSADELIEKLFSLLSEFKKKKKYPYAYPYPYPKKSKKMEALEKENAELKEKLANFEKKEIDEKVSELIKLEKEAGVITDENEKMMAEKFSSFSSEQLDALITQFKNFSAKKTEPKGQKDFAAEKTAEIAKLEQKIKDFSEAGLKTDELEAQLKSLKGE